MEIVRFGIVGLGRLGYEHASNLKYNIKNAKLKAICTNNQKELNEKKELLKVDYAYLNYEDMVKSKEIDAVVICSPSSFHVEHIKLALDNNLHVFCEKPLALDSKSAIKIANYIKKFPNLKFMLGFMRRFDPSYLKVKQMIDEGKIGKVYAIRNYSIDPDSRIDDFIKFSENSPSGGLFLDLSIHDYDLSRWFLQEEPQKIWSIGGSYKYDKMMELKEIETAMSMVEFTNNKMAVFVSGRTSPHGYHVETEILGTNGTIRIGQESVDKEISLFLNNGIWKEAHKDFIERFNEAYKLELEHFVSCIIEDKKPAVSEDDGVCALKMAEASQKSFNDNNIIEFEE